MTRHRRAAVVPVMGAMALGVAALGSGCAEPVVDSAPPLRWDASIEPIASFVAETYGHPWEHPVRVRFVDGDAFERITGLGRTPGPAEVPWQSRALGFAETSADEVFGPNEDGTILLGLYQTTTGTLLVRGSRVDAENEPTIAHELTHALQDQIHGITTPASGDLDREVATTAVIEGDARAVEARWRAAHPPPDATPPSTPPGGADAPAIPPLTGTAALDWWTRLLPYSHGWRFIEAALRMGGPDRRDRLVDLALRRRLTTLDVFGARIDAEGSDPPPRPPAGSSDGDTGPIGAFRWYALFAATTENPRSAVDGLTDESTQRDVNGCITERVAGPADDVAEFERAAHRWITEIQATATLGDAGTTLVLSWCRATPSGTATGSLEQLLIDLARTDADASLIGGLG